MCDAPAHKAAGKVQAGWVCERASGHTVGGALSWVAGSQGLYHDGQAACFIQLHGACLPTASASLPKPHVPVNRVVLGLVQAWPSPSTGA